MTETGGITETAAAAATAGDDVKSNGVAACTAMPTAKNDDEKEKGENGTHTKEKKLRDTDMKDKDANNEEKKTTEQGSKVKEEKEKKDQKDKDVIREHSSDKDRVADKEKIKSETSVKDDSKIIKKDHSSSSSSGSSSAEKSKKGDSIPKKSTSAAAAAAADDDDDDDDIPLSALKRKNTDDNKSSVVKKHKAEDGRNSSSSDKKDGKRNEDASLSKKPSKVRDDPSSSSSAPVAQKERESRSNDKKKLAKDKPATPEAAVKAEAKKVLAEAVDKSKRVAPASGAMYETEKGQMVQKLLCRWWYVMQWPTDKDREGPPSNEYVELDGYPGVYLCVFGDDIGTLKDTRNHKTCPCYTNFIHKSSDELKQLLTEALTNQRKALIEHWGEGHSEEANIKRELKWVKGIDTAKAEKEAAKIMKQKKHH